MVDFIFILLLLLFIASIGITYLIILYARKFRIIDIPNERSSHSIPTPRGGGVAIVVVWYTGLTLLFIKDLIAPQLYFALISGALLALISFLDDLISLRPVIRLISQIITSFFALFFLNGLDAIDLLDFKIESGIILLPFTVLALIWFINLFNFLDGLDGYASIEAICMALVLTVFTGSNITLVMIASVAGFLVWNWPKAKIFMGDVGSTQLGYALIVLGIYFNNDNQFNFLYWLLLSSPFWFDATLTLYRRWMNGETLSKPHKKHAYQRIVQAGFKHWQVNIILILINIFIACILLLISKSEYLLIPLFILTIAVLYILTRIVDRKVPF